MRHLGSSAVNSTSSGAEEIIESAGEKRTIDSAAELEASCCDDEKLGSDLSYPVIPPEILQLINASTLVKPEVLTYEQKFENRKSLFEFLAMKENYEMELVRHSTFMKYLLRFICNMNNCFHNLGAAHRGDAGDGESGSIKD